MNSTRQDAHGNTRCSECNRFVHVTDIAKGYDIKHDRTCESRPSVQPSAPQASASEGRAAELKRHGRNGSISAVATEQEIVDAVRSGVISMDDAMNRDF